MENKGKNNGAKLALIIAFCAALGAVFVLLLALPKHAGELSPLEFRQLADYPIRGKSADKLKENVVTGRFSSDVDSFLEDHFPGRSFFISLESYSSRLTGRNADKSVVWGKNGRLFDAPLSVDDESLEQLKTNVSQIDSFCAENGLEAIYAIVPSSAAICADELPALHLDYPQSVEGLAKGLSSGSVMELGGLFSSAEDPSGLLYRTDHHWTMEGVYACYKELCGLLGETPASREYFTVEEYDFYGSYYRKAGLWLTKPDTLEVWRSPLLDSMEVVLGVESRGDIRTGVYDAEKLAEGEVDKYASYLYSNNGLTVIRNPEGNGKTLMIVKDSYGNSIAPLLAVNYSNIIMIDTRYYDDPALPLPSELAAEYGAEKLVVVMGEDTALSRCKLAFLR